MDREHLEASYFSFGKITATLTHNSTCILYRFVYSIRLSRRYIIWRPLIVVLAKPLLLLPTVHGLDFKLLNMRFVLATRCCKQSTVYNIHPSFKKVHVVHPHVSHKVSGKITTRPDFLTLQFDSFSAHKFSLKKSPCVKQVRHNPDCTVYTRLQ